MMAWPAAGKLVEKIQGLPADKLAEVEDFVDFLAQREDQRLVRDASRVSEKTFKKAWNNSRDAAHDRP